MDNDSPVTDEDILSAHLLASVDNLSMFELLLSYPERVTPEMMVYFGAQ